MEAISIGWTDFRAFIVAKAVSPQYIQTNDTYYLFAFDYPMAVACVLPMDNSSDQTDFETNFKPTANKKLKTTDTDGSDLSRFKLAPTGWTFQDHSFEFTTGTLDSVYSKKCDGTDFNFCTLAFYEESTPGIETLISGVNLNQGYLDLHCTKTVIDWEPTHDYDVIGGELTALSATPLDVRIWVMVVPDIPAIYGGSKELLVGGKNMKYCANYELDGKVAKHLVYNPTLHTNKIRIIVRHAIGCKAPLEVCVDFYKA